MPSRITAPEIRQPVAPNVTADTFGAARARGLEQAGEGLQRMGRFFNEAAADNASNNYEEQVNKLLHGDPTKKGPDGQPDTGYFGLKGRAALDAREGIVKQMDELLTNTRNGLPAPDSQLRFNSFSRRFRAITNARVGEYADTQSKVWMNSVYNATAKNQIEKISREADNDESFMHSTADLIDARVKQAQLQGGGPELLKQAVEGAQQEALTARLNIISAQDPARAMRMLEANKDVAGSRYDDLYNRFRVRADQQVGTEYADVVSGRQMPLENGADTKGVIRHFEGFRPTPYKDNDGTLRIGYGSDQITKADGTVVPVTPGTMVSKEDAERDLERRATQFQNKARTAIGEEGWSKLSDKAKASLTSVTYNYGSTPPSVVAAARTGDPQAIAGAIMGLSGHNAGINARRRAQEAANVSGELPPAMSQSDILKDIDNSGLNPQAKAAATARANHLYAIQRNQKIGEKSEFDTRVKDSTAEAMQTGGSVNPVPQEEFTRHFGASEGAVHYQNYVSDLQFGADRQSFENLDDLAIQRVIDGRIPAAGTPGFAHKMDNVNRLRTYADKLQTQRREDPAGAVSRLPVVKDATAQYDPKRPETFQPVAQARLVAQENLGIEPEYQTPITKAEALQLTKPIGTMLPGQEHETITGVYGTFQKMFGDNADKAFAYALRARKVQAEVAQQAAGIMRTVANQATVQQQQARDLDRLTEMAASDRAVVDLGPAGTPGAMRAPLRVIGNPEEEGGGGGMEPSTTAQKPVPTPQAISFLIRNPKTAENFDKKFGTGMAKQIMQRMPGAAAGPGGQ